MDVNQGCLELEPRRIYSGALASEAYLIAGLCQGAASAVPQRVKEILGFIAPAQGLKPRLSRASVGRPDQRSCPDTNLNVLCGKF